MPLGLMNITRDGKPVSILALHSADRTKPIPPHAVVGQMALAGGKPVWSSFRANSTFLAFFGRYMRGELADKPDVLGRHVKPGELLYVIDKRVGNAKGDVPFEEIVGWYKTDPSGAPIASTFEYNADHALMRKDGLSTQILEDAALARALESYASPS